MTAYEKAVVEGEPHRKVLKNAEQLATWLKFSRDDRKIIIELTCDKDYEPELFLKHLCDALQECNQYRQRKHIAAIVADKCTERIKALNYTAQQEVKMILEG